MQNTSAPAALKSKNANAEPAITYVARQRLISVAEYEHGVAGFRGRDRSPISHTSVRRWCDERPIDAAAAGAAS